MLGFDFWPPARFAGNHAAQLEMDVIWTSLRVGAERIIDGCVARGQSGTFRGFAEGEVDGKSRLWVSSLDNFITRMKQRSKIELSRERLGQTSEEAFQAGFAVASADDMRFETGYYEL